MSLFKFDFANLSTVISFNHYLLITIIVYTKQCGALAEVPHESALSVHPLGRLFATQNLTDDLLVFPNFFSCSLRGIKYETRWSPILKIRPDESGGFKKSKKSPENEVCGVLRKIESIHEHFVLLNMKEL